MSVINNNTPVRGMLTCITSHVFTSNDGQNTLKTTTMTTLDFTTIITVEQSQKQVFNEFIQQLQTWFYTGYV